MVPAYSTATQEHNATAWADMGGYTVDPLLRSYPDQRPTPL